MNSAVSLDEHLHDHSSNNFKLIRLIAALLVMFTHCYGLQEPLPLLSGHQLTGSMLGLRSFFFLSGLLVAQSREYSPSGLNFLWRRFLRIYPAAVVIVIGCAFLLGPLVTSLSPAAYFTHPLLPVYLRTCLLVQVYYHLPGVFSHSPLGASVNSSLWSLSLELKLYAGLWLLGYIRNKKLYTWLIVLITLFLVAGNFIVPAKTQHAFRQIFGQDFVLYAYSELAAFFLLGTLVYRFRRQVRVPAYWAIALPVLSWITLATHTFQPAAFLLVPAAVLYCSVYHTRILQKITPVPDLSYGIYIYAFPVEQLIVNYLHPSSPTSLFLLNGLFVLPLALASWYGIESKALRGKSWLR